MLLLLLSKKFPLIPFFFFKLECVLIFIKCFCKYTKTLIFPLICYCSEFINIFYIEYRIHSTWSWNYPPKFYWIQFSNTLSVEKWNFLWTINHILIDPRLHLQFVFIQYEYCIFSLQFFSFVCFYFQSIMHNF